MQASKEAKAKVAISSIMVDLKETGGSTEASPLISAAAAAAAASTSYSSAPSSSPSTSVSVDIRSQREADIFPLQEELEEDILYIPWGHKSQTYESDIESNWSICSNTDSKNNFPDEKSRRFSKRI